MKNVYKIILLSLLTSVFCPQTSFSQTAPVIQWQNSIGGFGTEQLQSMKLTSDGGFILAGGSSSDSSGDKTEDHFGGSWDGWLIKTDSAGNVQWDNSMGGASVDVLTSVNQTADGGYIIGSYSWSNTSADKSENNIGDYDYWIIKTDAAGVIQYENTIGGTKEDRAYSVQQTTDGGYIIGGTSRSGISGDKTEDSIGVQDFWVLKLDASLNIQWQNTIGGTGYEYNCMIVQTTDGGYLVGGTSSSGISGDKTEASQGSFDYWILKLDNAGNITWQNTIGGNQDDRLYAIEQTSDNGFILGGYSFSGISGDKTEASNGNYDYWIVKTDSAGNIQWQNSIGGNSSDELFSVEQTFDGGYILGGWSVSDSSGDKTEDNLGNHDYWAVKTDASGNVQWENTVGGNFVDEMFAICQAADGGYALAGWSASPTSGDKTDDGNGVYDYWLVKLFPDTITGISQLPQSPNYLITISPNPFTTQSKLTFKNPNKEKFLFTLYDITGRVTESVSTTNNEIILNKGSKQPGVYLFNLMNEKTGERWRGKIVVSEQP